MSSLLILGAGGHGRVLAEAALASGPFDDLAFLDDRYDHPSFPSTIYGFPVLGPLSQVFDLGFANRYPFAALGIGDSLLRSSWFDHLQSLGFQLPVIIHPSAWISPSAEIGCGSVIFAQSAVQTNVTIGSAAIVNTSSSVDHDVNLGDFVHICPGVHLAGEVRVGDHSLVGIGSSVIPQITIGSGVTIGAGSSVVTDIPDLVTAVGVPASVLKTTPPPS